MEDAPGPGRREVTATGGGGFPCPAGRAVDDLQPSAALWSARRCVVDGEGPRLGIGDEDIAGNRDGAADDREPSS